MKNQRLSTILMVFFLFPASWGFSQDLDQIVSTEGDSIIAPPKSISPSMPVKNAVKTDLLSWAFKVGVLKYERVITESISAQLGFYYSWDFPHYDDEMFFSTGFSITPEFRFYLSKKIPSQGPQGYILFLWRSAGYSGAFSQEISEYRSTIFPVTGPFLSSSDNSNPSCLPRNFKGRLSGTASKLISV